MVASPLNKKLYQQVKKEADQVYKKPSAYKSGYIVKKYKELGGKYSSKSKEKPLKRWFKEKWTNQRFEAGYKFKSDIYRPSKIVSQKTPLTFGELSTKKIKAARKTKYKKGRVIKF
jgi:hypothetical protein